MSGARFGGQYVGKYLGKVCARGHEPAWRYRSNKACMACCQLRAASGGPLPPAPGAAKGWGVKADTYVGAVCAKGHQPAIRYSKGGACVACLREKAKTPEARAAAIQTLEQRKRARQEAAQQVERRAREWIAAHPDECAAYRLEHLGRYDVPVYPDVYPSEFSTAVRNWAARQTPEHITTLAERMRGIQALEFLR